MKKSNNLRSLGLSDDDVIVYESLLKHGPLSVTEIGAHTKLHRPSIYSCIESLSSSTLITEIPSGKRKKYSPLPPKQLKELLHRQEDLLAQEIIRLEDLVVPEKAVPKIVVLKGKQGLKVVYDQMMHEIKKGEIYYRYQAVDTESMDLKNYMSNTARVLRNAKELERFVITNAVSKQTMNHHHNRYVKVLPSHSILFDQGVGQIMYGDKTAIVDYNNEVATIIESKAITEFQKSVFKSLFKFL